MEIYFVTSNKNKLKEAESILKIEVKQSDLDLEEVQAIDTDDVVRDKAHRAYDVLKKPVMVEDTGLYVQSWKGFPGALIKWVLQTLGNSGLCQAVQGDRTTTVKTSVCIYNGKEYMIFSGEVKGKLTEKPQGDSDFGWDPVFQPDGYDKTFAEMSKDEKNKISMRKIALSKMKDFLNSNPSFVS